MLTSQSTGSVHHIWLGGPKPVIQGVCNSSPTLHMQVCCDLSQASGDAHHSIMYLGAD